MDSPTTTRTRRDSSISLEDCARNLQSYETDGPNSATQQRSLYYGPLQKQEVSVLIPLDIPRMDVGFAGQSEHPHPTLETYLLEDGRHERVHLGLGVPLQTNSRIVRECLSNIDLAMKLEDSQLANQGSGASGSQLPSEEAVETQVLPSATIIPAKTITSTSRSPQTEVGESINQVSKPSSLEQDEGIPAEEKYMCQGLEAIIPDPEEDANTARDIEAWWNRANDPSRRVMRGRIHRTLKDITQRSRKAGGKSGKKKSS